VVSFHAVEHLKEHPPTGLAVPQSEFQITGKWNNRNQREPQVLAP